MVKKIKVKRKRKKISRRNKNLIIGIVVLIELVGFGVTDRRPLRWEVSLRTI